LLEDSKHYPLEIESELLIPIRFFVMPSLSSCKGISNEWRSGRSKGRHLEIFTTKSTFVGMKSLLKSEYQTLNEMQSEVDIMEGRPGLLLPQLVPRFLKRPSGRETLCIRVLNRTGAFLSAVGWMRESGLEGRMSRYEDVVVVIETKLPPQVVPEDCHGPIRRKY
jgi:hypothetical protein